MKNKTLLDNLSVKSWISKLEDKENIFLLIDEDQKNNCVSSILKVKNDCYKQQITSIFQQSVNNIFIIEKSCDDIARIIFKIGNHNYNEMLQFLLSSLKIMPYTALEIQIANIGNFINSTALELSRILQENSELIISNFCMTRVNKEFYVFNEYLSIISAKAQITIKHNYIKQLTRISNEFETQELIHISKNAMDLRCSELLNLTHDLLLYLNQRINDIAVDSIVTKLEFISNILPINIGLKKVSIVLEEHYQDFEHTIVQSDLNLRLFMINRIYNVYQMLNDFCDQTTGDVLGYALNYLGPEVREALISDLGQAAIKVLVQEVMDDKHFVQKLIQDLEDALGSVFIENLTRDLDRRFADFLEEEPGKELGTILLQYLAGHCTEDAILKVKNSFVQDLREDFIQLLTQSLIEDFVQDLIEISNIGSIEAITAGYESSGVEMSGDDINDI